MLQSTFIMSNIANPPTNGFSGSRRLSRCLDESHNGLGRTRHIILVGASKFWTALCVHQQTFRNPLFPDLISCFHILRRYHNAMLQNPPTNGFWKSLLPCCVDESHSGLANKKPLTGA